MVYILRFFPLQNAVCFIILKYLVPVLFTFFIQGVLIIYKNIHGLFIWGREGVKWARDLVSIGKVGRFGLHERSMLLPSYV